MSDIVPPSLGLSGAATQAPPAGVAGTVTNPPQAATQLPSGAILHGTVIRLDGPNRAVIRTDLGTLEVSSHAHLTVGSQVTLQVRSAGSRLHVVIMQVDGHPAHTPPTTSGQASSQDVTAPSKGATDVLVLGQRLYATVQSLPPRQADAQGQVLERPLPAVGSRIEFRVLRIQAPGGPPSATPAGSAPTIGATLARTSESGPGRTVPAVVTGLTLSGQPVVETPLGNLTLDLKASLPNGTRLSLELTSSQLTPDRPAAEQAAHGATLAFGWSTLDEALELLQRPDLPTPDRSALTRSIPRPGPRLASTILFFLQALSGGDLRGWLGVRAVEVLERAGRGDLLSRLDRDFTQLARMSESTGGDWRLLTVPLLDGSHVQPLRLFVRRRRDPRGTDEAEGADIATRFILDVELTRFGDIQLDGLVRDQRFDLILRTRRLLSDEMRREITEIFNEANSAARQHGQISFQASDDWSFMAVECQGDSGPSILA